MARAPRATYIGTGTEDSMINALATIASAKNPDDTDFALPIISAGTLTDRSGTITTGGTAQQAMAANTSRKYAAIENPASALLSPQRDLWYSWTGTAAINGAGSHLLQPGESVVSVGFVMTNALSIIGATTGQPFTAEEG